MNSLICTIVYEQIVNNGQGAAEIPPPPTLPFSRFPPFACFPPAFLPLRPLFHSHNPNPLKPPATQREGAK